MKITGETMTDYSIYQNPLCTRYASKEMQHAFSDEKRFKLWRKLWIALAESEMELGLNITPEQVAELKKYADDIDYEAAERYEREVRHDVMAHVKAYGAQAKSAMPIIHLGATSCFVNCNSEIIMIDDALNIIQKKLVNVMDKLKNFALKYKDLPTLGFTHLQPAQLTTVGKRATLWLQDLEMDYENLMNLKAHVKLRGVKGTTGTQASFLELFDGDEEKVRLLEKKVVEKMGYEKVYGVTGQTYPRKFDYNVLCVLSQIAQSAYKFSNDIRILQNMKEIEEPFEKNQIGSSAMAYKRNPMRCERIGSLARYVVSLPLNSAITSSTQWFERTLDDSANRRIVNAQAFLSVDAILNIYMNVAENLVVYDKVIEKHIKAELPFMATENIMMECVKAGGNRQELHERIRVLSMEAGKNVKMEGKENNLIELILQDEMFKPVWNRMDEILDAKKFIGRAPSQTVEFIKKEIDPILSSNASLLGEKGDVRI
jgi:adenylosuccinate lyase